MILIFFFFRILYSVQIQHFYCFKLIQRMRGHFGVSIIHQTLSWTAFVYMCIHVNFLHAYPQVFFLFSFLFFSFLISTSKFKVIANCIRLLFFLFYQILGQAHIVECWQPNKTYARMQQLWSFPLKCPLKWFVQTTYTV